MVHDGFVDFKNEISDICSMDMENIVIVVSSWNLDFLFWFYYLGDTYLTLNDAGFLVS